MLLMFTFIFSTSCFFLVLSSILMVISKNALHSILFLASSFFFGSMTIFLLENEFLALFFLIIYLGAIIVLFLFVVMMLDLKQNILKTNKTHFPVGALIGVVSFFFVLNKIKLLTFCSSLKSFKEMGTYDFYLNWQTITDSTTDINVFAGILYTNYAPHLIVAGLLLYVSVVAVVFLTTNSRRKTSFKTFGLMTKQLSRTNVL